MKGQDETIRTFSKVNSLDRYPLWLVRRVKGIADAVLAGEEFFFPPYAEFERELWPERLSGEKWIPMAKEILKICYREAQQKWMESRAKAEDGENSKYPFTRMKKYKGI